VRATDQITAILSREKSYPFARVAAILIAGVFAVLLVLVCFPRPISILPAAVLLVTSSGVALLYLKRSYFALEKENEQYRKIFDAIPCYLILLDTDLRILWTDGMFRRTFGEKRGAACYEIFRGEGSPCPDCSAHKTFRDGGIYGREQRLTTEGGKAIDLIVYSAPLTDDEGEIVAVLELAVNITSVKEIQKQLILMGQAVAGMAHSIKNIMMGLDGGIYVVNRGIEADDPQEFKEGWEMVQLNYDKIARLVQDILYCSKEREPDFEVVEPNDVVKEVYDLYRDTARSYEIEINLNLDENLGEAVMDPLGLHTVVANLVSNAMDACKVDLWKDTHLIELTSRKGSDGATILEVSDNGIGMEKELKDTAFEDFFSTKGNQGTGLGLMVTQKVMDEHGGSISFRSTPSKGTTFTVVFPPRTLKTS